jgi:hypothetical protein
MRPWISGREYPVIPGRWRADHPDEGGEVPAAVRLIEERTVELGDEEVDTAQPLRETSK